MVFTNFSEIGHFKIGISTIRSKPAHQHLTFDLCTSLHRAFIFEFSNLRIVNPHQSNQSAYQTNQLIQLNQHNKLNQPRNTQHATRNTSKNEKLGGWKARRPESEKTGPFHPFYAMRYAPCSMPFSSATRNPHPEP